jgi:NAD(P)H dehydrogenase (quinone)
VTTLITGASGLVGRRVAELLAERRQPLRLLARDPSRAPHLPGAEVVTGDYADPTSLRAACSGVTTAFVVSGYGPPGERAALHANVFRAAAAAGVAHLVYLSFQGASPTSRFSLARDHHESEQALAETGVRATVLRDNVYLDLIPEMFGQDGVLRGPGGEGAVAFVAREDVAHVVAAVLTGEAGEDRVLDVTGPEALTLREVAERLSAVSGLDLRYEDEPLDRGRAWRGELGVPEWQVEAWLGTYLAIAAGELASTSDTVRRLTGRDPIDLEAFVLEHPQALAHLRPASAG